MLKKIVTCAVLVISSSIGMSAITPTNTVENVFVPSGDAKLFCRIIGKGKPLIVIHGGPGISQDYLLPGMYNLAENNRVIFYDQRGCGQSTSEISEDSISMESFVNDIEAIRKFLDVDKISILGHSWGGFVAMQYAIAFENHLDKLILSNSAPATSEGYALFGQEYMRRMLPYQDPLDKMIKTTGFLEADPDVVEQFYRLIFRQYCYIPEKADLLNLRMTSEATLNGRKVSEILRKKVLGKPFDLNSDLKALKVSALILHGDYDPIPVITAKGVHDHIFKSKFILMKNCGHFPYVEDPVNYFEHIKEFLNSKI